MPGVKGMKWGKQLSHVKKRTQAYFRWKAMMARCYNPKDVGYKNYGGRGVKVCPRWKNFRRYYFDTGNTPTGKLFDRVDNSKGYWPNNWRWATRKQQQNNRRPYRRRKR